MNKLLLAVVSCFLFVSVASADSFPFFFYEDGNSPASPRGQMHAAKPSSAVELFAPKLALVDASTPFGANVDTQKSSTKSAIGSASNSGAQDALASAAASDDFLAQSRGDSGTASSEFFGAAGHFSDFDAGLNSGPLGSSQNSPRFDSGMFFSLDSSGSGHGAAHHGNGNGSGNGAGNGNGNGVGNSNNNGNDGTGSTSSSGSNLEIVSTPEPSSLLLLAFGAPLFFLFYKSRSARKLTDFHAN